MSKQRIGCLGAVLRLFGIGETPEPPSATASMPKVMVSNRFLSPAEVNFFRVLVGVVGSRGHVLAQVSLRQLLYLPGSNHSNPGRAAWQNKLASRSVDFLVCDAQTLRPLVVIELDEPTHARPDRQTRDDEVERALRAAGLPFLRLLVERSYDTRELAAALEPHVGAGR